jgi:putative PIN family toxin of toxin-antitoxin system
VRLVFDTNIIISALLWHGAPRHLLHFAHSSAVQLYTSLPLLLELDEVLRRDKFLARLQEAQVTADDLLLGFAALATTVEPLAITPVVLSDPDDDNVLACALAAQADVVVSGDRHLLQMGAYSAIPILPADVLIDQMGQGSTPGSSPI